MQTKSTDIIMHNKFFVWIALATGLILLIPLIAMQFSDDVDWTASDFVIMGILLFGVSSLFVLVARPMHKKSYRVIMGIMLMVVVLWLWAELAVGIFTNCQVPNY